jgi:hypothetical protein
MPKSRVRKPAKMPVGRASLMSTRDKATGREHDAFVVSRQSRRSYRWSIVDRNWSGERTGVPRTGTASTHAEAEKLAKAAWRLGCK